MIASIQYFQSNIVLVSLLCCQILVCTCSCTMCLCEQTFIIFLEIQYKCRRSHTHTYTHPHGHAHARPIPVRTSKRQSRQIWHALGHHLHLKDWVSFAASLMLLDFHKFSAPCVSEYKVYQSLKSQTCFSLTNFIDKCINIHNTNRCCQICREMILRMLFI